MRLLCNVLKKILEQQKEGQTGHSGLFGRAELLSRDDKTVNCTNH